MNGRFSFRNRDSVSLSDLRTEHGVDAIRRRLEKGRGHYLSNVPNALAYGSGYLEARDFLPIGILFGAVVPAISVLWSGFVLT